MTRTRPRQAGGFTLVELLTVISIIALLISILLPSLAQARAQAKKVKVQTQIDAIGKGLEMFRNDNRDQYPYSARAQDRISDWPNAGSNNVLSGAHWLARAMVGGDLQGIDVGEPGDNYPAALKPLSATAPAISYATEYSVSVTPKKYERRAPYIQLEAAPAVRDNDPEKAPNASSSNAPNTGRLILLDGYGFPILYYRAEPGAEIAFTQSRKAGALLGTYCQEDNADFTGSNSLSKAGWDLKPGKFHNLKDFDTNAAGPMGTQPRLDTFNEKFFNPDVFKATQSGNQGAIKPYNADSFILLSPGADGIYGTRDDVKNFKVAQ
ncbi:MAG: type II secretion system protein [Phycisphaerae bacterium]